MVNLGAIAQLVHVNRMHGGNPAEIHLNKITLDEIKEFVRARSKPVQDTRSLLGRMRGASIPGLPPPGVYWVAGLPAIENEKVMDGCVVIRPAEAMQDPDWMEKLGAMPQAMQEAAQAMQEAVANGETPWIKQQRADAPDGEKITVDSLVRGKDGLPTPSDVLMYALENVDSYSEIIVVKVTKSGDVYLAASMHQPAAVGYLQKVFQKLM